MRKFALSSAVTVAPLDQLTVNAYAKGLLRLEKWWSIACAANAEWENLANVEIVWSPEIGAIPEDVGAAVVQLVAALPDAAAQAAGDIAYHTVDVTGRPVCYVLYQPGRNWTEAMSHEILESRINPLRPEPLIATGPSGVQEYKEVCDRIQGTAYEEPGSPGIALANALGPQAFVLGATRAEGLDIASDLRAPTATAAFPLTPGGYWQAWETGVMTFGDHVTERDRARLTRTGVRGGLVNELRRIASGVAD